MVPADGQPVGHETVWQPQGAGQGAHTSENFRALGHTPVQFIQVSQGCAHKAPEGFQALECPAWAALPQIELNKLFYQFTNKNSFL